MKRIILLLAIVTLLVAACDPDPEPQETVEEVVEEVVEEALCTEFTVGGPHWTMCMAANTKDLSLCANVNDRFRESCVVGVAEAELDIDQLQHCSISKVANYRVTCEALITKDINKCFGMAEDLAELTPINIRDCIDVVARKMQDPGLCELHVSRALDIAKGCGSTPSCNEEWIASGPYNKESCVGNL